MAMPGPLSAYEAGANNSNIVIHRVSGIFFAEHFVINAAELRKIFVTFEPGEKVTILPRVSRCTDEFAGDADFTHGVRRIVREWAGSSAAGIIYNFTPAGFFEQRDKIATHIGGAERWWIFSILPVEKLSTTKTSSPRFNNVSVK